MKVEERNAEVAKIKDVGATGVVNLLYDHICTDRAEPGDS